MRERESERERAERLREDFRHRDLGQAKPAEFGEEHHGNDHSGGVCAGTKLWLGRDQCHERGTLHPQSPYIHQSVPPTSAGFSGPVYFSLVAQLAPVHNEITVLLAAT